MDERKDRANVVAKELEQKRSGSERFKRDKPLTHGRQRQETSHSVEGGKESSVNIFQRGTLGGVDNKNSRLEESRLR